jgi:branched-chain amino acid transport system substrate-binding protein
MRKGIMNFLAVTWVVFAMCIISPVMAAETVRIGSLFPLSGPLALLGNESFNGAIIAADMVNDKGGLWGKKIEWVKGDAVDPKKAMTECERLINVEKLKLIMGTYGSSLAYAATEVAERNKVLYWEQGGAADPVTERGFKYTFRLLPRASNFGITAAEFANEVIAPKLGIEPKNLKVAVIHEDSLAGTIIGGNAAKRAIELGMKVIAVESYSLKTVDLSPVVMILKDRKPDVLFALQYLQDGLLFYRQAKDMKLNVKAFVGMGACYGMPDFGKAFGDEGNYVFEADPAVGINPNIYSARTKALLQEFKEKFNKKFGHIPAVHASLGFTAAHVLFEDVLPRAGCIDPEAVRKAALGVDIPKGGTIMGYGVKFAPPDHPSAGTNLLAHVVMLQWQEQQLWSVYPKGFAIRDPLLPFPTWEERAKGTYRFTK